MKKILLIALIISSINSLSQNVWEQASSPSGSDVHQLFKSPQGSLFASTLGGVYRSENNGDFWIRLELDAYYPLLAINSQGTLFAINDSGHVFRSTNEGDNWDKVLTVESFFTSIVVSSQDVIYAADLSVENDGETSVYVSTDNGNNWTRKYTNSGNYNHLYLTVNPSGHVFAMSGGNGIYRSTNEGDTWTRITSLDLIDDHRVKNLVFNSRGDMFVGFFYNNYIYRSNDNGESWNAVFKADAVFPLAASSNDDIYVSSEHGLFRLKNNGNTWSQVNLGIPKQVIRTLYIDSENNLFCGANGIFRSTNDGASWSSIDDGMQAQTITSIAENSQGDQFVIANALYLSRNNSTSWTKIQDLELTQTSVLSFHPNGDIYLSNQEAIYKSTDYGSSWHRLFYMRIYTININAEGDIFLTKDGGILKSNDNGNSWTLKNNGLACNESTEIFISSETDTMYALDCSKTLYVSTDNAEHWVPTGTLDWGIIKAINSKGQLFAIQGYQVLMSSDNGSTWQEIYNVADTYTTIHHLVIDANDNIYIALSYRGIYKSNDNGATWESFNEGLRNLDVHHMYVSRSGYLYACPSGSGIWRINLEETPGASIVRNYDIYPNPANEVITLTNIQFSEAESEIISIYNMQGILVKRVLSSKKATAIDVNDLPKGMYLISTSGITESQKLIVQ